MARRYDIRITLTSQLKKCPAGHKVGDEFVVGRHIPGGMCMGAFNALIPFIMTLRFGGSFPWEKDPDSGHLGCHIEAIIEPDFVEPRGCEGEFFGRELRMVDEKDQHYWGVLEGERFVGETAWGCFECEPWGVFELYR